MFEKRKMQKEFEAIKQQALEEQRVILDRHNNHINEKLTEFDVQFKEYIAEEWEKLFDEEVENKVLVILKEKGIIK